MTFTILFILSLAFVVLDIILYVRRESRWAVDKSGNVDAVKDGALILGAFGFFRAMFRLVGIWLMAILAMAFVHVVILGNSTLAGLF